MTAPTKRESSTTPRANEVVAPAPSLPRRLIAFSQDVVAEMRKVTWPDRPQVQQ
ncbi:MAG: preprotein translocase subunit SecE, partial [Gemmatimonadota bacterium]